MITLTKETVLENARRAWRENRLQAQHPEPSYRGACRYRDPRGYCCVIGASLDDATARSFDSLNAGEGEYVNQLIRDGHIASPDRDFLVELQSVHDAVVRIGGGLEAPGKDPDKFFENSLRHLQKILGVDEPTAS